MAYTVEVDHFHKDKLYVIADAVHKHIVTEKKKGKYPNEFICLMKFYQDPTNVVFVLENKKHCTFDIPDSNTGNITHLRFPFGITSWSEYERTEFVKIINEEVAKL